MKHLILKALILLGFVNMTAQDVSPIIINLEDTALKMSESIETEDKWVSLTNQGGVNILDQYPIRPEYDFPGAEVIYKLPRMDGEYFFYVNDRFPDKELDVFVLTDPYDATSAMMWMNGTGAKQYMKANPNQDYYLVLDAFENVTASLNFAVAPAVELPFVCLGSTDPIMLADLRTLDPEATEIDFRQLDGEGGSFDEDLGIFIPDENTTTSVFEIVTNFSDKNNVMTENITIFIIDCSDIPTINQWAIILIGLISLILGIVVLKRANFPIHIFVKKDL